MPEPNAAIVVASAVLVLMAVVALAALFRHRDPVGRAVAGHADLLGALRETAIRSTNGPAHLAGRDQGDRTHADRADHGVNILHTVGHDDNAET